MTKRITNFALDLDDSTLKQFDHCCSQDFVISASLMPDAHSGYVAPIGSVMVTKDYVVPSWVGYDIGCGMIACKLRSEKYNDGELVEVLRGNANEIFNEVKKTVPMGNGKVNHIKDVSEKTKGDFKNLLTAFKGRPYREEVYRFLKNKALSHLGSLGSGNHFIEISTDNGEDLWLIIHSGSRGVGHTVATYYMKESSGSKDKYEATHGIRFDSELGKEYLNVLNFGLDFALLNRLEMAYKVKTAIKMMIEDESLDFDLWVNKNHNHALPFGENGSYIHRKGATPAQKGERGVIPANMRDGSFLVEGLGNKDFLESSSHGAGRKLSRRRAREEIKIEEFKETMVGIIGTVNEKTLDEAPDAYKDILDVMEKQKESVKIIKHLKPLINWKGE